MGLHQLKSSPESPEFCVDLVLFLAQKRMQDHIDVYKTDKNENPKLIHDSFPHPKMPNQAEPV